MRIKNKLAEERQRSRLTQAEVATFLGIDVTTVAKHESGLRMPSRDHLIRYANLFKVETIDLFDLGVQDVA